MMPPNLFSQNFIFCERYKITYIHILPLKAIFVNINYKQNSSRIVYSLYKTIPKQVNDTHFDTIFIIIYCVYISKTVLCRQNFCNAEE